MKKILVAPSLLSADFSKLAEEIREVEAGGADLLHVDVMDGHFVPNLTIGPLIVSAIRRSAKLPLDVHLMIEEPEKYLEQFAKAGANTLIIHVESKGSPTVLLKRIRALGIRPAITLRPKTPLEHIERFLPLVDQVLVMTVEPGFGGQSFMSEMLEKVEKLRAVFKGDIEVDGGINAETAAQCLRAGANILVAGSYIFSHNDRKQAIKSLRACRI